MNNVYIGARYVPILDGDWSNIKSYEPLTTVNYGNNSYTSKRAVPVGIAPTNSEYWQLTGNYNGLIAHIQNEITDLTNSVDSMELIVNDLKSKYNQSTLNLFKNKSVCIFGDSISDETTYNPNWVDAFTEIVSNVGATVTNATITGYSLVALANDITKLPTGYDIYIIALGVNDFQGQFDLSEIRNAIGIIASRIDLSNENRKAFYISPLKMFRTEVALGNPTTPLGAYRCSFEILFNEAGFSIISGDNVPNLSIYTQPTYMPDTLHPASIFRYIFASHIIDVMISGVSEHSFFRGYRKVIEVPNVTGFVTILWTAHNTVYLNLNINAFPITAYTWTDLIDVTGLLKDIEYTLLPDTQGNIYQLRVNNGKLQIVGGTTGDINISGTALSTIMIETSIH